ncbi:MAG: hypothetical protein ACRDHL_04830, partial [Candidatus Promineifilaceae bacterium]
AEAASAGATGTALAATAAFEGDADDDGLSNGQEQTLGTLPDNPDSDGDGLSDGQEVNQHQTDPLEPDSDGDGLTDGAEVNEHGSSPTNPDSDDDGVSDGDEVLAGTDPLQPPTATPPPPSDTPTSAPTATPSQTPTPQPSPSATPVFEAAGQVVYALPDGLWSQALGLEGNVVQSVEPVRLVESEGISSITFSPNGGRVAFLQELSNSNNQLVVVNFDGSGLTVLADSGTLSQQPVPGADPEETRRIIGAYEWLADGETLAFTTVTISLTGPGQSANQDLWLADVDGNLEERFAPGEGGGAFAISDENQLLFATSTEIIRVDLDGGNRDSVITFDEILTYSEFLYYPQPVWLPGGEQALVAIPPEDPVFGDENNTLWEVPDNGSADALGEIEGNLIFNPVFWSTSGAQMAYVRMISEPSNPTVELFVGPGDGNDLEAYGEPAAIMAFLDWNPSGNRFLYTSQAGGNTAELHIAEVGEEPQSLTLPAGLQVAAAEWLNDVIYVIATGASGNWIYSAAAPGGGPSVLASTSANSPAFDVWAP